MKKNIEKKQKRQAKDQKIANKKAKHTFLKKKLRAKLKIETEKQSERAEAPKPGPRVKDNPFAKTKLDVEADFNNKKFLDGIATQAANVLIRTAGEVTDGIPKRST